MANITTSNSGYQTGEIDTASTLVDGASVGTLAVASQINGLSSAIIQLETILGVGTTLKGSVADLVTRLAVALAATGKLNDFSSTTKTTFPPAVAEGGTGLTAGTSGGVPYYSGTTIMASSGLLTANAIVLGGGAGATPTSMTGTSGGVPYFNTSTTVTSSGALTANGILYGGGAGAAPAAIAALTNGQLPIGRTGSTPLPATLTGTANQVTVTNASGSITLSGAQDLHTGASPTFATLTLTTWPATVIGTGQLRTATGSATGSLNDIITMNDYAFFPSLSVTPVSGGVRSVTFTDMTDPGNTTGRFQVGGPEAGNTWTTRWRYMTASDDPTIWISYDEGTGKILGVWASDDPTPTGTPGLDSHGSRSVMLKAADLQGLDFAPAMQAVAADRMTRDGLKREHLLYRTLQLEANDPAPAAWILAQCVMDHGRLVRHA